MPRASQVAVTPIFLPPGIPQAALLIADSDRRSAQQLQRMLTAGGYQVRIAGGIQQALRALRDHAPDAVLLGDSLSDRDRDALCRRVKLESGTAYVPVICLSSLDDTVSCAYDSDYEPDAVLQKPVDPVELQGWLRTLLRIKQQFDRQLYRHATETRSIDQLKSDIINNVSHELGTPLLQVKSAVSLLTEDLAQHGSRDQVRIANMAAQAVARLEDVLNNIRQLARSHDLHIAPVIVDEAADLAIRNLQRSWASRGARERIEKRIADDIAPVLADKRGLGHLLQLLLDNALKFSAEDMPVYILATRLNAGQVWIGVQDFGIGIPPEQHDQIFQAFYRIDNTAARRQGGTGTGLALAMLLASGMNTTIHIESVPQQGSTFSFVLPVARLGM